MKTYLPKVEEIDKKWVLFDAEKEILGKLAVKVANALRGKDEPTYTPHLDTGANVISLDSSLAAQLGISLDGARRGLAQTAGGETEVSFVTLKDVQVGAIKQHNVRAVVTHASHPPYVLLGMTFLQHVDIRENAGLMVLTSKL